MPAKKWILFDIGGAAGVGIHGVLQRENASTIAAIEAFLAE